ncbi:alpha/beta hydrolase family protein [Stappia stellulata]|uniref:alpha/beta hydrolase family protein n=1 Tax=Stappia stellulata TaxID=71235 RepID=UPI000412C63A|nr:alpha/beta hydrolase [Stappia stellulata]
MTGKRLGVMLAAATLAAFLLIALAGMSDFDLSDHEQEEIVFATDSGPVAGTLLLPGSASSPPPVVLVVHGDGPQDRYSADGYGPLFNALLDAGIGVFSWDKPGVGASAGNWHDQSMQDRAAEARAARDAVERTTGARIGRTGYLGFSQAGWVLPKIAAKNDGGAFYVLVGGAVNWQRQGDYLTRRRLQRLGWSREEIAAEIARQTEDEAALEDLPEAARPDAAARLFDISRARARFVLRNRDADAAANLENSDAPFLAVWGEDDLNVDAVTNARDYTRLILPNNPQNHVVVIPDATHALLRSRLFNYQRPQDMPWWAAAAFVVLGRHAYSDAAIATITTWIQDTTTQRNAASDGG